MPVRKGFYERTDINEFLREHPMVSDLYDAVLHHCRRLGVSDAPLIIFNRAYELCMQIVEKKETDISLFNRWEIRLRSPKRYAYGLSIMVAWSMLSVHQGLLEFDEFLLRRLRDEVSLSIVARPFELVTRNFAGKLDKPINFSGTSVMAPVVKPQVGESPHEKMEKAGLMMKASNRRVNSIKILSNNNKFLQNLYRVCE